MIKSIPVLILFYISILTYAQNDPEAVSEKDDPRASVKIYPNPVQNSVFVVYESNINEVAEFLFYNNQGINVLRGKVIANSTNEININFLEGGFI